MVAPAAGPGPGPSLRQRLIMSKSALAAFVTALIENDLEVFAPKVLPADPAIGGKDILVFRPVTEPDDIQENLGPGSGNTVKSVRELFFPQTETLFKYKIKKGETAVYAPELPANGAGEATVQRVVIGVRPCDAAAMAILDKVFTWDFDDQFWLAARGRTLLIGLGCVTPPSANCFCTSLRSESEHGSDLGPFGTKGLDMLLIDLGANYAIEVLTDRAEKFLDNLGTTTKDLLTSSTVEDDENVEQIKQDALGKFVRSVAIEDLPSNLNKLFEDPYWADVARRCIGCGTCTHVCPTCHCFDIQDVFKGSRGVGQRERVWDSCMYGEYTLHGSGHNPRPARKFRIRNRVLHKYAYYPERFGEIACVGCGRCVDLCPVNIDIIEMLGALGERLAALEANNTDPSTAKEVEI